MSDINLQMEFRQKAKEARDAKKMQDRPKSMYGARSVRSLKSFKSQRTSIDALSKGSFANSAITTLPEIDPVVMMSMVWEVFQLRKELVPKAKQEKIGLREVLTSTKLLKLMHTCGYMIKHENLKALLKEVGFNWNGACCSIMQLIEKLKAYINEPEIDQVQGLINAEKQANMPKTSKGVPVD